MTTSANWTDFDSDAINKIENDITVPHSVEKATEALPDDSKLDLTVDLSFNIKADSLSDVI